MIESKEVSEQDVERLLAQCCAGAPDDVLWAWSDEVICEAVRQVPVVFPALAILVVGLNLSEHLLARDDVPPESMRAVWSLVVLDSPESDLGPSYMLWGTLGRLLRHPEWRAVGLELVEQAWHHSWRTGELAPAHIVGENRGQAAAAYVITDPTAPLAIQARLLRALARSVESFRLSHLELSEPLVRAAYHDDAAVTWYTADNLLDLGCVLRDPVWSADLIGRLEPRHVGELPLRALRVLPDPERTIMAVELLQTFVLPDPLATQVFALRLCSEQGLVQEVVTKADMLRCIAASPSAETREQLLRLLPKVPSQLP